MCFKLSHDIALSDLLELENDASFLEFRCPETGVLLWPLVRMPFFRFIISDLFYDPSMVSLKNRNFNGMLSTAGRVIFHNARHWRHAKGRILIIASGAGHFLKMGRWFNRLSDYFAFVVERETVVMEDLFNWFLPYPRHNQRAIYSTPMLLLNALAGRILVRSHHIKLSKKLINYAKTRANKLLKWDLDGKRSTYMQESLARKIAAIPIIRHNYIQLLKHTGAKVVIKEEGCYGYTAVFNATARELGLVTAEYQHGGISSGHYAYNLAPALVESETYRHTLPDYFLGYGQWWNDQINIPITKLAIGNPHRSERIVKLQGKACSKSDILILGDGFETEMYLGFTKELARIIGNGLRVVFRPHPSERSKIQSESGRGIDRTIHIDRNTDIYDSFSTARIVVSEASTGLFEALGIVERILIRNTGKTRFFFPKHPFETFVDVADLSEKVKDCSVGRIALQNIYQIWAPNWRSNYLTFLRDIGGVSC